MKRIIFLLLAIVLLFVANNKLSAQYNEVWGSILTNDPYWSIVGSENMDTDPQKEIVFVNSDYHQIIILDGNTGIVDWDSGIWSAIANSIESSEFKYNDPRLIDVNNDGIFELLFFGRKTFTEPLKMHLFSSSIVLKVNNAIVGHNSMIEQNFPNPFTESTNIAFKVDSKSLVIIKTFDTSGKQIETVMSEQKLPGDYVVNLNTSKYQTGTYFYQVIVGNNIGAKKMIKI